MLNRYDAPRFSRRVGSFVLSAPGSHAAQEEIKRDASAGTYRFVTAPEADAAAASMKDMTSSPSKRDLSRAKDSKHGYCQGHEPFGTHSISL